MRTRTLLGCCLVLLAIPAPTGAADGEGSAQFRLGGHFLEGDSDLWTGNEAIFTFDTSDLNDAMIGASYVATINNHFEIGFNLDYYDSSTRSAYRGITDLSGNPIIILHDTRIRVAPMTVDFRLLPGGRHKYRGRDGRYRVRKPVLYLGAGAGLNFWEYEEEGEFIDAGDFIVFDRARDSGTALEAHVLAGVELPVGAAWSVLFEGRYSWSEDDIGIDSVDPFLIDRTEIDLSGASVFVGASLRF